jgi:hypothetical protein
MKATYECQICKAELDATEAYEYRGAYSCSDHFDQVIKNRDFQRQQIMEEESNKTKAFKGLDLSDNPIGKANRQILKPQIEIAGKESARLREYEGR